MIFGAAVEPAERDEERQPHGGWLLKKHGLDERRGQSGGASEAVKGRGVGA